MSSGRQYMSLLSDTDNSRGQIEPMDIVSETSNQTWLQDGLESMQLKRSQMNDLIMEYLVHEGFKEAAERFREEAGIEPINLKLTPTKTNANNNHTVNNNNGTGHSNSASNSDISPTDVGMEVHNYQSNNNTNNHETAQEQNSHDHWDQPWSSTSAKQETVEMLDRRIEVRQSLDQGDILKAQSLINLYYPEMLDNHKDIYFRLQQQHLIELIREQKINDVLAYVHSHLSVEEVSDLNEMEKTLALLAYDNPDKSPYSHLMDPSHRSRLTSDINDLMLQETLAQVELTRPKLVTLLKLLLWTQNELEKKKIQFPKMTDLVNSTIMEPRHWR